MPRRIDDYRGLTQISRVRLLRAVQHIPGRRLQELADETGLHVNTTREHLQVLEDEGLIVSRPVSTGTRGRPPVVFDPVTQAGVNRAADERVSSAVSRGDLVRKLYPSLDNADRIGEEAQRQLDVLHEHLDDVGFEPELREDGTSFNLSPCAFHELIDEEARIVCSMHARLIQTHLAQVEGPLRLERLLPLVTEHQCQIILGIQGVPEPVEGTTRPTRKTGRPRPADS